MFLIYILNTGYKNCFDEYIYPYQQFSVNLNPT
jgi:hypothetical protein